MTKMTPEQCLDMLIRSASSGPATVGEIAEAAAIIRSALSHGEPVEALLKEGNAVFLNMMRGSIAIPSAYQLVDVCTDRAGMLAALKREAPELFDQGESVALDAQRYRRLRVLGCAVYGTANLDAGTVSCFTNLDEVVDADIKAVPSRGEHAPPATGEPVGYVAQADLDALNRGASDVALFRRPIPLVKCVIPLYAALQGKQP